MFLRRCAWHRKYHGHVKFLGVSSWRGWGVTFSDGMCADCAVLVRAEWQLPAAPRPAPVPRFGRTLRPEFAIAAAVLLLAVTTVTFGIAVGPPSTIDGAGPRAVATPVPAPSQPAVSPEPATASSQPATPSSESVPAGRQPATAPPSTPRVALETPAGSSPTTVVEAPGKAYRAAARPVRVVRAGAKRPVPASYRPVVFPLPVETVSAPESPKVAPAAPLWVASLTYVEFQAP